MGHPPLSDTCSDGLPMGTGLFVSRPITRHRVDLIWEAVPPLSRGWRNGSGFGETRARRALALTDLHPLEAGIDGCLSGSGGVQITLEHGQKRAQVHTIGAPILALPVACTDQRQDARAIAVPGKDRCARRSEDHVAVKAHDPLGAPQHVAFALPRGGLVAVAPVRDDAHALAIAGAVMHDKGCSKRAADRGGEAQERRIIADVLSPRAALRIIAGGGGVARHPGLGDHLAIAQPGAKADGFGRDGMTGAIKDAMRRRQHLIGRNQHPGAESAAPDIHAPHGLPAEQVVAVGQPDKPARLRRCPARGKAQSGEKPEDAVHPGHGFANFAPVSRRSSKVKVLGAASWNTPCPASSAARNVCSGATSCVPSDTLRPSTSAIAETTDTMRGCPPSKEKTGAPLDPKSTSQDMMSTPCWRAITLHTFCSDGASERSLA